MFAEYELSDRSCRRSDGDKLFFNCKQTVDNESWNNQPTIVWEPSWIQPQNFDMQVCFNTICPACGKTVFQSQPQLFCQSPQSKYYVGHLSCIENVYELYLIRHKAKKISSMPAYRIQNNEVGSNQHLVQISFTHPLSNRKLFQASKKLLEYKKKIYFISNLEQNLDFSSNIFVVPIKQFKCSLNLKPLFKSQRNYRSSQFIIDLEEQKKGIHFFRFEQEDFVFQTQLEIIADDQAKKQVISKMNLKYTRPFEMEYFVVINRFTIQFRGNQKEPNPQNSLSLDKQFSNCHLSNISQKEMKSQITVISQKIFPQQKPKIVVQPEIQPIPTSEFVNQMKTQGGSKQFQKKVKNYGKLEIDRIIAEIIPFLEQVVLDNYANYMFQSLLAVCSFQQRKIIIQNIGQKICKLVCQQQGTFVFQQLILLLTMPEQFALICKFVTKDFKNVALDSYGFHFLRKLFEKMPTDQIIIFLPTIYENFGQFSTSKNAIFILKCALNCLVTIQNMSNEVSPYMVRFLQILCLHTQNLIDDEFGNYLIQQTLQKVAPQRIKGVFDYIIKYFTDCSCNKISSNVVINCITKCWKNFPTYFVTLKNHLDRKNIRSMYYNKDGNRVLLEIMELSIDIDLQDKIYDALKNEQASKFNSRKWIPFTGKSKCKTGAVGTTYSSFSEAISFNKRKQQQ